MMNTSKNKSRRNLQSDNLISREQVQPLLLALKQAARLAEHLGLVRVMIKLNYLYFDIIFSTHRL